MTENNEPTEPALYIYIRGRTESEVDTSLRRLKNSMEKVAERGEDE